jgi:hypothetical protein
MSHVEAAIVATKTATLGLGALIAYFSYKAYARTGERSLRALSVGFAVVTLGAVAGGVIDLVSPLGVLYGVLAQSLLTLVGFAVITYSLYAD